MLVLDLHDWPGASGSWHESGTRCWLAAYSWWLSPYPRPPCICSRRVKKNLVNTGVLVSPHIFSNPGAFFQCEV